MTECVAALALLATVQGAILLATGPTGKSPRDPALHTLQRRYLLVYLPAALADWLQGPYVYKLYRWYGYGKRDIALLYVAGFVSSLTLGSAVGPLADAFGRKRLCVVYGVVTSASCLAKLSSDYGALLLGRVLSGVGTSILTSAFEAWYVWQHVERCGLPPSWMGATLAKASFYNGLLGIAAGLLADAAADGLQLGPAAPFLLAVPCLAASAGLAAALWDEAGVDHRQDATPSYGLTLLLLGATQSLFESVMYIFVFLWTPVLEPMSPPYGVVFSCFMLCLMLGSSCYSLLVHAHCPPAWVMTAAVALAALAFCACAAAVDPRGRVDPRACFAAFLVFELAVGAFFPAAAYLRGRVLPERLRAGVATWFRAPVNLATSASLLWLNAAEEPANATYVAFVWCLLALLLAALLSGWFSTRYVESGRRGRLVYHC